MLVVRNRFFVSFVSASVLLAGAVALGHHICQPLSSTLGANVISEVPYATQSGAFGIPAHRLSNDEIDHSAVLSFQDGDSFSVADETGAVETIVLHAADFGDISNTDLDETLAVIDSKATLFSAFEDNGYAVFRGFAGGSNAKLQLADGQGSPLQQLLMQGGLVAGSSTVGLEVSVPGIACGHPTEGQYAGYPYRVFASTTPGSFSFLGQTVPLGPDATTLLFEAIGQIPGALPGFSGTLDSNEDAAASLSGRVIRRVFGGQYPDKLYLSYVVMTPDLQQAVFASNVFTVDFQ